MKDISKSIAAAISLGDALVNNRVSRSLIGDLKVGLENDFSKHINCPDYKFSIALSSVGLEDAFVEYHDAVSLIKEHTYSSMRDKLKISKEIFDGILESLSNITTGYEVNNELVDKLLHYYNNEAKGYWEVYEDGSENKIEKFKLEQKDTDVGIDLRYDSSSIIELITESKVINETNRKTLLYQFEGITNTINDRNIHYPFLSFIQNLTSNKSIDSDVFIYDIIKTISTKVSAVKLIDSIINNSAYDALVSFTKDGFNYYSRKYFDIVDIENIAKSVDDDVSKKKEYLSGYGADSELLDFLNNSNQNGIAIFMFFVKLIYSKDIKANEETN